MCATLLDALSTREDVFVGLLTGNFEEGARIKLGHFDLWRYFRCGAYGDDAADRNALVPFALERARRLGLPALAAEHVLVVGDTPHDVACAHAVGALPVGVATGGFSVEQLRASGAPIVFDDLSDTDAFPRARLESPEFAAAGREARHERARRASAAGRLRVEWRKRLGVEPSPPAKTRAATDFEDREGHRAPFASVGVRAGRRAILPILIDTPAASAIRT